MNKINLCLAFLLSFITNHAQDTFDEKSIIQNYSNYFKLERENIHVQFDKTIYTKGETIWLKGYVINKINDLPNIKSSNVIMDLYNRKGEKIDSKLLYAEKSTFNGHFETDKITESGKYYFRFFTNHMNNFSEDESSTFEITIINPSNYNNYLFQNFDIKKISVNYFPESGNLLHNCDNSIVVDIKDCNGLGATIENIEVLNENNNVITTFSTNQHGIGKFKLIDSKDSNCKIKIKKNEITITEKVIEKPIKNGYIISINDNYNSETLFIDIKTNSNTLAKKEKIWFGIQHLGDIELIKFDFENNSTLKKFAFLKKDLNYGINNFFIINENKQKLAERLYYNHNPELDNKIEITNKQITKDSIKYIFKSNFKLGEISYSALPSKTITKPKKYSIHSSLSINNNINKEINNLSYYLDDYNRLRHFELDNVLQTVKYKYSTINNFNLPDEKFKAENGLTLHGKINSLTSSKGHKISLLSISTGTRTSVDIDENNEFRFNNLIVDDSTSVHLTLIDKKGNPKEFSSTCNLIKPKNLFFKQIQVKTFCQEMAIKKEDEEKIRFPNFSKNSHLLDSIYINKTDIKKKKLTNNKNSAYLNGFIDGYKVTDEIAKRYVDIITFLRSQGYDINNEGGQVSIATRAHTNFRGDRQPTIMMNNTLIIDVSILYGMRMEEIDEIYINKRGYGAGSTGANGVISIFTKKTFNGKGKYKTISKSYICDGGFISYQPFKNNIPANFADKSFIDFGTFFWKAKINTNEDGVFEITIPKINDQEITVIMEGVNSSGLILSKTINLKL